MEPVIPAGLPGQLIEAALGRVVFIPDLDWVSEEVSYTVESDVKAVIGNARTSVRAVLTAEIKWYRGADTDPEPVSGPFEMEVDVVGDFDWGFPEATDDDIKGWVEFNAMHLLWPYLRSYVTTITAASPLPVLTIYTISAARPTLGLSDAEIEAHG